MVMDTVRSDRATEPMGGWLYPVGEDEFVIYLADAVGEW